VSELKIDGFRSASSDVKHRLIISTEGLERSGKTNFGLTLPEPIAVLPLDNGTDEIVAKFKRAGKQILVPAETLDWEIGASKEEYLKLWGRVEKAFNRCLTTKGLRSLFIDTGTEMWELKRLAAFGKLTQVMPQHYMMVNEEFRKLIRAASDSNLNIVLSHKVKKRYVGQKAKAGQEQKESWDGTYERSGMNDVGFLVQMNLLHTFNYETHNFRLRIKDCRQNMDLAGTTIGIDDDCDFQLEPTFQSLGQIVYPESSEDDWR